MTKGADGEHEGGQYGVGLDSGEAGRGGLEWSQEEQSVGSHVGCLIPADLSIQGSSPRAEAPEQGSIRFPHSAPEHNSVSQDPDLYNEDLARHLGPNAVGLRSGRRGGSEDCGSRGDRDD